MFYKMPWKDATLCLKFQLHGILFSTDYHGLLCVSACCWSLHKDPSEEQLTDAEDTKDTQFLAWQGELKYSRFQSLNLSDSVTLACAPHGPLQTHVEPDGP